MENISAAVRWVEDWCSDVVSVAGDESLAVR